MIITVDVKRKIVTIEGKKWLSRKRLVKNVKPNSTELQKQDTAGQPAELGRIVSRKEAKKLGLTRYFTGKPCIRGHISEKNTNTGKCYQCRVKPKINAVPLCVKACLITSRSEAIRNGSERYFTGEICKNNHIDFRVTSNGNCLSCQSDTTKRFASTIKRSKYIERYKNDNRERISRKNKEYAFKNRSIINKKSLDRYHSKKSLPEQKAIQFIRNSLKRLVYSSGERVCSTGFSLNYTRGDLVSHMESLFTDGMSWDNHGEWHIDHIKPVSYFVSEGITDPNIVNALSNLRPLWAAENISKGSKLEY